MILISNVAHKWGEIEMCKPCPPLLYLHVYNGVVNPGAPVWARRSFNHFDFNVHVYLSVRILFAH
jgi:hypothetical protein